MIIIVLLNNSSSYLRKDANIKRIVDKLQPNEF